ncbi:hypothetical protein [Streptomyces sp. NPDC090056]
MLGDGTRNGNGYRTGDCNGNGNRTGGGNAVPEWRAHTVTITHT